MHVGRHVDAIPRYEAALRDVDENVLTTETLWGLGMLALARLRAGDRAGAHRSAERAVALVVGTKPVAYWTQHGTAATAEVPLERAITVLGGIGALFEIEQARAALGSGS